MTNRQYPEVMPWDVEPHYSEHVSAMTAEGLHLKADIAAQLALRDQKIAQLRAVVDALPRCDTDGCGSPATVLTWSEDRWCDKHGNGEDLPYAEALRKLGR